MMLKKIALIATLTLIFGCNGDNDDIIEPNDVVNIDLDEGIVFGSINPLDGSEVVYLYTSDGVFAVTDSVASITDEETGEITEEVVWETNQACPFVEGSLTYEFSEGVPNVARGIRDISSTDYTETFSEGIPFYVLEYVTSGNRKTIQITDTDSYNEEQINTYFSYIKNTLILLADINETSPTICDDDDDLE